VNGVSDRIFLDLMAVNAFASRTYNDITSYPVFPWILADYESETVSGLFIRELKASSNERLPPARSVRPTNM
jgi:hypothetical protein